MRLANCKRCTFSEIHNKDDRNIVNHMYLLLNNLFLRGYPNTTSQVVRSLIEEIFRIWKHRAQNKAKKGKKKNGKTISLSENWLQTKVLRRAAGKLMAFTFVKSMFKFIRWVILSIDM